MLTYKIHIIRHGITQANLDGKYIGRTDLPLCEQGRAQLLQLCQTCDYPQVDRVYTSPLLRAKQTAQLLYPDRMLCVVDELRELDFGEFENRDIHDLEKDPVFHEWTAAGPQACAPGGESSEQLQNRAIQALAHIYAEMMEQRIGSVAVVTHGALISSLLANMGLPQREAIRWNTAPGKGYTLLLCAQMWMRDHKFEVYSQIPMEKDDWKEAFFVGM